MRLLLDTHTFVWALTADRRLSAAARALIEADAEDVQVSLLAFWEIALKAALKRMPIGLAQAERGLETSGYDLLPLRPPHIRALAELPLHRDHRDPFDRMLVAQARAEGLTLMTEDAKLRGYGVPTVGCA